MSDDPSSHPHFIVNARCAGSAVRRRLEWLQEAAGRAFPGMAWQPTAAAGHAIDLARDAAVRRASLVVAVGGDGTINEVVNGLLSAPADCRPTLGVLPVGTGSDFARTLGVPHDLGRALALLSSGRDRRIDVGEIECAPLDGAAGTGRPGIVRRFFVNMAGCGASGRVVELFNERKIRGAPGYAVAAARAAWDYRWPDVDLAFDEQPPRRLRLNVLFVCNGEYCGRGMRVGRGARLDDGLLRVVEAGNVGRLGALLQWPRLYGGHLDRVRGVRVVNARVIRAASADAVLVDCDGELCGRLPATYRVVPGALAVRG